MKKFIFLKSSPGLPVQGADISVFERCALLQKYGWQGELVSTGEIASLEGFIKILNRLKISFSYQERERILSFKFNGTHGHVFLENDGDGFSSQNPERIHQLFRKSIKALAPQALMGNARDPHALKFIAQESKLPRIIFLTEDEFLRQNHPGASEFLQNLTTVQNVVVASQYLAKSLKSEYDLDSTVLANAVALDRYRFTKETSGSFITLMHPYPHKGAEFFIELARSLPERKFLVAAGAGPEYKRLKPVLLSISNITLAPFSSSPVDYYQQSRIVLVPSIWQEAFSRVIIEAMCTGTPVITSGTGGMQQTGGKAALHVPVFSESGGYNLDEWRSAITKFDDDAYYRSVQEKGLERISEYEIELEASLSTLSKMLSGES